MLLGITLLDIVMFAIGAVLLLIWAFLFIKGSKYSEFFEPLEGPLYRLKETYGIGYYLLEKTHYSFKSDSDKKLRQSFSIIYTDKFAEYYLIVTRSQQIGLALTFAALFFPAYAFTRSVMVAVIVLVTAVVVFYYYGKAMNDDVEARSESMLHDFSDLVSKLALLVNSGLILKEAWKEVAFSGDSDVYKEMQNSVIEMENGISDDEAIYNFSIRCTQKEIRKFASALISSKKKGNSDLIETLMQQSAEVWDLKRQIVRRKGETAADKLLFPMILMFIGILIMIIVPIFANIGL